MRLASRAKMFRHVSVSCAATGATWKIDTNENIKGYDGGKTWDNWTKIAMQSFQAYGIPVFPCTGALKTISDQMRDNYHFRNTIKVQHVFAEIVSAQMHLAMLHSSIKEIAHGRIEPWGPHPVLRNEVSNYKQIWKQRPKEEGLGIPGPGNWREFRAGAHAPFGVLLRCIASVRFNGVKNHVSYDHIGIEELHRGMLEPVQAHRDFRTETRGNA